MASEWIKTILIGFLIVTLLYRRVFFGYYLKVKSLNAYEISFLAGVSFRFLESLRIDTAVQYWPTDRLVLAYHFEVIHPVIRRFISTQRRKPNITGATVPPAIIFSIVDCRL